MISALALAALTFMAFSNRCSSDLAFLDGVDCYLLVKFWVVAFLLCIMKSMVHDQQGPAQLSVSATRDGTLTPHPIIKHVRTVHGRLESLCKSMHTSMEVSSTRPFDQIMP